MEEKIPPPPPKGSKAPPSSADTHVVLCEQMMNEMLPKISGAGATAKPKAKAKDK